MMLSSRRLGVPMGTRLEMITHHPQERVWKVWVAIKSKQVPPEQYLGTYLELHQDGRVIQRTIRPDEEEEMEVMESYDNPIPNLPQTKR